MSISQLLSRGNCNFVDTETRGLHNLEIHKHSAARPEINRLVGLKYKKNTEVFCTQDLCSAQCQESSLGQTIVQFALRGQLPRQHA